MMQHKITAGLLIIMVSFLILVGVALADGSKSSPLVKVGGIYGLTGLLPDFGDHFLKGSQLYFALQESRSSRLSLIVEDSRWDSKTAVAAFQKLVDIDGVRVVHVMGSGPSLAIKPLAERRSVLLFSAGAHPQLIPGSSLVLRHANLGSEDAHAFADFVAGESKDKSIIATIFLQNDWGEDYDRAFREELRVKAPGITVNSESHFPADSDFRSVLVKLLKTSPEALVVNSSGIGVAGIIEQTRQLGFRGRIYVNNGLALSQEAQTRIRLLKDQNIFYQHYPKVPNEFAKLYSDRFKSSPIYFSLVSFTDMELLDYAVSKVGSDTRAVTGFIKKVGTFPGRYATLSISPDGDILIPTLVERFE